jgi:hypothetical protein
MTGHDGSRQGFLRMNAVARWLGETLFSRWGAEAPRSLRATIAWWIIVVAAGIVLNRSAFWPFEEPLPNDCHAVRSLEIAVHRQQFGCVSHVYSDSKRIFKILPNDSAMLSKPLRDLPHAVDRSTEDYAGQLVPFCNNENSLMLIDRTVLWLVPDITLASMTQAHMILKAACLAVFVLFLLRIGSSPLLSLTAFHFALLLVRWVNRTHPISVYPFLMPLALLFVSCLGLLLSFGLHRRLLACAPAMLSAGFLSAFLINIRSSYAPIVAVLLLLCLSLAALDLRRTLHRSFFQTTMLTAAALLCFVGGSKSFTALFLSPIQQATAASEKFGGPYSYHVVAHPLVLFLAVPPNDFARREGIVYDDVWGLKLAHRIDPTLTDRDRNYDNALFVYYLKLWLYYPDEMADLYGLKFRTAAATLSHTVPIAGKRSQGSFHSLSAPVRLLSDWRAYIALFAILAIVPLFLVRVYGPARSFVLAALPAVGLLLFLEMGWLSSCFLPTYHSVLLFCFLFVGMLCYQGIIDGVFHGARWVCGKIARRARATPHADRRVSDASQKRSSRTRFCEASLTCLPRCRHAL